MSIHVIQNQGDLDEYREAYKIIENLTEEGLVEYTRKLIEEGDSTIFQSLFYSAIASSSIGDTFTSYSTYDIFNLVSQYTILTHVFGGAETSLTLYSYSKGKSLTYDVYAMVMNKFLDNFIGIYENEKYELESTIKYYLKVMHASSWEIFVKKSFVAYKRCIIKYIGVEN